MFFYIGDNCPIKLNQVEPRLFLDDGWNYQYGVWYKGYSTECVLKDSLIDIIDGYQPSGKWCVIFNDQVYHPVLRGFPLYELEGSLTNLLIDGYQTKLYPNPSPSEHGVLTLDEVSEKIGDILLENTRNFYKFNNPADMTVILTSGLDTLTSWVLVDQVTKDYTLSIHLPTDQDSTLLKFQGTVREYESELLHKVASDYWGYYHACFYKQPNWNITGYYAEVYTYRDGEAINAIARYHGKRIDELANENDYLYWFLKRPNIVEKYRDSTLEFSNDVELKKYLWSTIWYDHQMWHLDNNLMFSPFADIRIPDLVNALSVDDLKFQCVTGQIQRNIIQRFRPDLLCLLSDYKNVREVWKNFKQHFNESMLSPNTKLIYR